MEAPALVLLTSLPSWVLPSLTPSWLGAWHAHLVKLEEALQEAAGVLQQPLAWLPVVIHLRARLLSRDLLGLDALHDAHSFYDQLHTWGWSLHGTHLWARPRVGKGEVHHRVVRYLQAGTATRQGGPHQPSPYHYRPRAHPGIDLKLILEVLGLRNLSASKSIVLLEA